MKTLKTKKAYTSARAKIDAYNKAVSEYCREHKTNGIHTDITKTFPFAEEVTNDLRSAVEVYEFKNDPPKKYFLYVNLTLSIVTTWTGEVLGNITYRGAEYRSNFWDKRQQIWVTAINGKKYQGVYFKSAGDYATVRMLKN